MIGIWLIESALLVLLPLPSLLLPLPLPLLLPSSLLLPLGKLLSVLKLLGQLVKWLLLPLLGFMPACGPAAADSDAADPMS